jgi:IS605 OrfB family transposase
MARLVPPNTQPKALKAIRFYYRPTFQTNELLQTFRSMINHAIHICLEENIRGRLELRNRIYKEFQEKYNIVSCYPYSVAEVAWSIVKKHRRWQRRPFASRLMFKMDSYNYSLNYSIISLPFKKGERILIPLRYGDYQRSFLMDTTLKRGSVTMTESTITIAFSKETHSFTPLKKIGYDLNEKSIVGSDGTRIDLSEVARLHTEYGVKRRDFYKRHPADRKLKKKYAGSSREKERVKQLLHRVAKEIVTKAMTNSNAIILERLQGIRYAHQKGNRESRATRRRISLWPFRQLQSYIEYNAVWEGVPFEYVNAKGTSQTCHLCKSINRKLKLTEREWRCPSCGVTLDRDLNAAINIECRGKIPYLGVVRPEAQGTDETRKGNGQSTAPILRVEALKSTR